MIRAQARAALLFPLLLVALVGLEFLASGAVGLYHQYRIVVAMAPGERRSDAQLAASRGEP